MRVANAVPLSRRKLAGMTLIELMVSLGIGSFLMIGAVSVFVQSRATFLVNESIARLQENARYVFDVIEPDIRIAHFWGLRTRTGAIGEKARPDEPLSALTPVGDCGTNWTVNLGRAVEATNDGYAFSCPPYVAAVATADTLTIRRASTADVTTPLANTLYLMTTRADNSTLFEGPALPPAAGAGSEIRELVVSGYYVSTGSSLDTAGNPVPSLRRKFLRGGSGGATIADEEILPGVEDLQIQLGIDTDLEGTADYGAVDRYINGDDPMLDETDASFDPNARILAVRLWLRLRSERPETELPPGPAFEYADQDLPPIDDNYRRLLVTKTIYLRNAR
jgi:type IV pilus assembly protein PilW